MQALIYQHKWLALFKYTTRMKEMYFWKTLGVPLALTAVLAIIPAVQGLSRTHICLTLALCWLLCISATIAAHVFNNLSNNIFINFYILWCHFTFWLSLHNNNIWASKVPLRWIFPIVLYLGCGPNLLTDPPTLFSTLILRWYTSYRVLLKYIV